MKPLPVLFFAKGGNAVIFRQPYTNMDPVFSPRDPGRETRDSL